MFLHAWAQVALADPLASYPGSVLRVDLAALTEPEPVVHYLQQRVLVHPVNDRWQALVGIPLDTAPGWQSLDITTPSGTSRVLPFTVVDHDYPVQHLSVRNPRHVTPSAEDLARYARERDAQDAAKSAWRDQTPRTVTLRLPARGRRSSAFGLRRTFNGEARSPHRGLDLAVPTGTPVVAPADGRITLTGDYFFNGRTLFIDHGKGLISMLCHLSSFAVARGDPVSAGQLVGRSGATGRATGPHVHWSVFLNGTAVDPAALLAPD